MNTLVKVGSEMVTNASQFTRTQVVRAVGKVMEPLAGTISFMLDLAGYILQDPDAWKRRLVAHKKELIREDIREYVFESHGRVYGCRERLLVYAIRGKNRRTPDIRFTYWVPTLDDIIHLNVEELRKIKYN